MFQSQCPHCQTHILFDVQPEIGQSTFCSNCRREARVSWLFPLLLCSLDESSSDSMMDQKPNNQKLVYNN